MADLTYYQAPAVYKRRVSDPPSVFLAGGIPGTAVWQDWAVALLHAKARPLIVVNPRRQGVFPAHDRNAVAEQVRWEHEALHEVDVTMFWFPESGPTVVQPTTLFELGMALGERRLIVVGADPGYARRDIVEHQVAQYQPDVPLHSSLPDTVAATARLLDELR